jgi:protocatechuate 3,4-dioxygenase beta subunit
MSDGISRRDLLRTTSTGLATGVLGLLTARPLFAQSAATCEDTPQQEEGPFYPVQDQPDKDNDLTAVPGQTAAPLGQVIYIFGTVTDEACQPVKNALVEIWQACASGRYNHPGDTSDNPLDPNFQYWGQALSDASGKFSFKTIVPGHYNASDTWIRPPHIHWKAHCMGYHELTTQMYFDGNEYNAGDLIRRALSPHEQDEVTIKLIDATPDLDVGAKMCTFDITLARVV